MGLIGYYGDAFVVTTEDEPGGGLDGYLGDAFTVEENPLTLTSLTPDYGRAGDTVVLAGMGFLDLQGTSKVYFGALEATVSAWSNTEITVTVPAITSDVDVKVVV